MQDPIYAKIEGIPRPSLFAASGLILVAAVGLWVSAAVEYLLPDASEAVVNLSYYLPFVALPVALYMGRRPGLSQSMRLNPLPVLPTLGVVLLALISVYAASAMAVLWGDALNALGLRSAGSAAVAESRSELALSILSMAALPAVCEELLFRGFALAAWERQGTRRAIAVTAALFALLHGNLFGLPVYLLVGAIAGFVTFALDSLYAGIVYHTVYNAACLILPWLLSGVASEGEAAAAATAVGSLVFQLALELTTLMAMMAALLVSFRLYAHSNGIDPIPRIHRPLTGREKGMLGVLLAELTVALLALTALANLL